MSSAKFFQDAESSYMYSTDDLSLSLGKGNAWLERFCFSLAPPGAWGGVLLRRSLSLFWVEEDVD